MKRIYVKPTVKLVQCRTVNFFAVSGTPSTDPTIIWNDQIGDGGSKDDIDPTTEPNPGEESRRVLWDDM